MRDKRKCRIKSRATIICLRSGRVLLVRKKGGKWNFPGGLIEPGESPHAAAARELREETSIEGHGLLSLCSIRVGSVVHHIFTTRFHENEKDRVPGSGVTEPAEGALRAKEDGHRGSWLTLSLR
ncbi:MAG: NUDIX domain-containing protein, partial [Pseudomonas putida]|nr:NUDIX domain-containing protein [Pseudomonas putida]